MPTPDPVSSTQHCPECERLTAERDSFERLYASVVVEEHRLVGIIHGLEAQRDALQRQVEARQADMATMHSSVVHECCVKVQAMQAVVDAACEYVDTVHRYDVEQSRRVGRGSRAGIRRAVVTHRAQQEAEQ